VVDEMETFSLGDTIRVELDLRDESGISTVSATFYELESNRGFMMRGESEGESEATVVLTQEVTREMLPGEYRCEGVTVYDTHLNRKNFWYVLYPEAYVWGGDHERPELVGWRVSTRGSEGEPRGGAPQRGSERLWWRRVFGGSRRAGAGGKEGWQPAEPCPSNRSGVVRERRYKALSRQPRPDGYTP
jgi:hypothetical protein